MGTIQGGRSRQGYALRLQPLRNIYLGPPARGSYALNSDSMYSYIFASISVLVLMLSSANFSLLTLNRTIGRLKSLGIRKALGARTRQLVAEHMTHFAVLWFASVLCGVTAAVLLMPSFGELVNRPLKPFDLHAVPALLWVIPAVLLTTGCAVLVPTVWISRISPVEAMLSKLRVSRVHALRNIIISFQYVILSGSLTATWLLHQQVSFLNGFDLGYDPSGLVVVRNEYTDEVARRYKAMVSRIPGVVSAALSDRAFTDGWRKIGVMDPENRLVDINVIGVDADYISLLGVSLKSGRNFKADSLHEQREIIVNETLVEQLRLSQPVGHHLQGVTLGADGHPRIIGVVDDFHTEKLHIPIGPLILHVGGNGQTYSNILIRTDMQSKGVLSNLRDAWAKICPNGPFLFAYLDEELRRQYDDEHRWLSAAIWGASFSIGIVSVGVIGVAALIWRWCQKEMAIRRVFGAQRADVFYLFLRRFACVFTLSGLMGWAIASTVFEIWMEQFSNRIESVSVSSFLFCTGSTLFFALSTLGYHGLRASITNPIAAFRAEDK